MDQRERAEREAPIVARAEAGDVNAATTAALRLYGPEIYGFLLSLSRGNEAEAGEAFAAFSERLWRGIGAFSARSSLRTWAYTLARNAYHDEQRLARRRDRHVQRTADVAAIEEIAARIRTETWSLLRTEKRTEVERLRECLSAEDQMLLILRVDRGLEWLDLARVFLSERESRTEDDLRRESTRLRKRFQLVKRRLYVLGTERGLFEAKEAQ